ncbi:hypothetical protein L227DRAFT_352200 [Lentinus tigrinus ALCF2SS1-6]|uniref:Uncharacterized protein n=1 Tax=Lentinus tigrinus ALCF2SS1-6 TaxID=1328759 RepID=A0A5C2RRN3_9APHY|nr:hypothetical protein L227DRAFT_352200 [Lentinus tigrinus ALCF2SS1-6]
MSRCDVYVCGHGSEISRRGTFGPTARRSPDVSDKPVCSADRRTPPHVTLLPTIILSRPSTTEHGLTGLATLLKWGCFSFVVFGTFTSEDLQPQGHLERMNIPPLLWSLPMIVRSGSSCTARQERR